jgi:hypothetical protein
VQQQQKKEKDRIIIIIMGKNYIQKVSRNINGPMGRTESPQSSCPRFDSSLLCFSMNSSTDQMIDSFIDLLI